MTRVTMHKAKTDLSKLVARVLEGDEVVILRGKQEVARLVPIDRAPTGRRPGTLRDRITFDDGFFDPLPDDELAAWEG